MKEYTIYFGIFGKKMKTTVKANSKEDAKAMIKNQIIFHKITENDNVHEIFNDIFDSFKR